MKAAERPEEATCVAAATAAEAEMARVPSCAMSSVVTCPARPEVSRSKGVDSLPPLAAGVAEVLAEGIDCWSREGWADLA